MMTPISPEDFPHVVLSRRSDQIPVATQTEQRRRFRLAYARALVLSAAALIAPLLAIAVISLIGPRIDPAPHEAPFALATRT